MPLTPCSYGGWRDEEEVMVEEVGREDRSGISIEAVPAAAEVVASSSCWDRSSEARDRDCNDRERGRPEP